METNSIYKIYNDEESTDVRNGTDVEQFWNFYVETIEQINHLQLKKDIFAKAYLEELGKCYVPSFLNCDFIDMARIELKDNKDNKRYRDLIIEKIFDDKDFIKNYNIKLSDIINYESYDSRYVTGMYLCFTVEDSIEYQFYVPNYKKPNKLLEQDMCSSDYMFQVILCQNKNYSKGLFKSYNWKEACNVFKSNIINDVTKNKS